MLPTSLRRAGNPDTSKRLLPAYAVLGRPGRRTQDSANDLTEFASHTGEAASRSEGSLTETHRHVNPVDCVRGQMISLDCHIRCANGELLADGRGIG